MNAPRHAARNKKAPANAEAIIFVQPERLLAPVANRNTPNANFEVSRHEFC